MVDPEIAGFRSRWFVARFESQQGTEHPKSFTPSAERKACDSNCQEQSDYTFAAQVRLIGLHDKRILTA
jgi:hypothetical protein